MKKILSITLALAIVMSLFCCVPVSAAQLRLGLPYLYEDFEDRYQSVGATDYNDDFGYNSLKSGIYTQSSNSDYWIRKGGEELAYSFRAGETLQLSFMLKLGQALNANNAGVHLRFESNLGRKGATGLISEPANTTSWQKVTITLPFTEETSSTKMSLRFGTGLNTKNVGANNETTLTYYVDNFEMKVIPAEIGTYVRPYEDFDDKLQKVGAAAFTEEGEGYGDVGYAGKYTWNTNGDKWIFNEDGTVVTESFAVGDILKFSAYIKLGQPLKAGRAAGVFIRMTGMSNVGPTALIPDINNTTDWQYIEGEYKVTTAGTTTKMSFRFGAGLNAFNLAATDNTIGDSVQVYYLDNVSIKHITAAEVAARPVVSNAAVNRVTKTQFTLGYTFTSGLTDASIVKLVATEGTQKSYLQTYLASEFANNAAIALPHNTDNKNLSLEIVPVATNGYVGDTVTVAIPAYKNTDGIILTQNNNSVTITTDTAIDNAKLIFVTYDDIGMMIDWEAVDVTLDAQTSQTYAPADLTESSYTKAMLWYDMIKCKPLANSIQY